MQAESSDDILFISSDSSDDEDIVFEDESLEKRPSAVRTSSVKPEGVSKSSEKPEGSGDSGKQPKVISPILRGRKRKHYI